MLILVVYDDGTHDLIEANLLELLIQSGKVARFCRASGWVKVGRDSIRSGPGEYDGVERRIRNRNFKCPAHLLKPN